MPRLVIKNLAELQAFQKKVKVLRAALPFIQKNAIDKVSKETVLAKIKARMKQNEFSQKIIDATFVGKTEVFGSKFRTHFISNYVAPENGFDVSEAREEGTADHNVFPKKKGGVLRWIGKAGNVIFAKKSRPKGIERLLIIERTLKESENDAIDQINIEKGNQASKIFGV